MSAKRFRQARNAPPVEVVTFSIECVNCLRSLRVALPSTVFGHFDRGGGLYLTCSACHQEMLLDSEGVHVHAGD